MSVSLLFILSDFVILFFFFQAEDGIRDGHVTGVQTCALPIWPAGFVLRSFVRPPGPLQYCKCSRGLRTGLFARLTLQPGCCHRQARSPAHKYDVRSGTRSNVPCPTGRFWHASCEPVAISIFPCSS